MFQHFFALLILHTLKAENVEQRKCHTYIISPGYSALGHIKSDMHPIFSMRTFLQNRKKLLDLRVFSGTGMIMKKL